MEVYIVAVNQRPGARYSFNPGKTYGGGFYWDIFPFFTYLVKEEYLDE